MKKTWIAALMVTALASAHADTRKGASTLSLLGGAGYSNSQYELGVTGGEEPVARGGGTVAAQFVYYFQENPTYGIGVDVSGTRLSNMRTLTLVGGVDTTSYLRSNVILAIMKLAYPTGRLRPYIFGGIGAHRSHAFVSGSPYGGFLWRDTNTNENRVLLDTTETSLAFGGGIGLDLYLTESIFLGAEYRSVMLAHDRFEETPQASAAGYDFQESGLDVHALLLSVGLKFGPS